MTTTLDGVPLGIRGCNDPDCSFCSPPADGVAAAEVLGMQVNAAALDLAYWSRSWSPSVGGEALASLIMGELVMLYLDEGRSEADFVASVQFAFRSVKAARDAIAPAVHPPEG